MSARTAGPSPEWIAQAHRDLLPTFPNLNVAWAAVSCWACGFHGALLELQRAHIVAHAHGGSDDDPANFWLLCNVCHGDQPDAASFDAQLQWIRERQHYSARFMEWSRELIARLAHLAERAGNHDLFMAWVTDVGGAHGVYALLRAGAARSAGNSFYTERANAAAYVEEQFAVWLRDRAK